MKTLQTVFSSTLLASMLAVTMASGASAEPEKSLSDKVMEDHPGTSGAGSTDTPNARPDNDAPGIQRKAMKEHPGDKGGKTEDPTAMPLEDRQLR